MRQSRYGDDGEYVGNTSFHQWATSVMYLFQLAFEQKIHYQLFYERYQSFVADVGCFESCLGIFLAAKEDYEEEFARRDPEGTASDTEETQTRSSPSKKSGVAHGEYAIPPMSPSQIENFGYFFGAFLMIAVGVLPFVIGIRSGYYLWMLASVLVWGLSVVMVIMLYLKTKKTEYRLTQKRIEWQYYVTSEIVSRSMFEELIGIGTIRITFQKLGKTQRFRLRNIKRVRQVNTIIAELGEQRRIPEQHIEHFVTNR